MRKVPCGDVIMHAFLRPRATLVRAARRGFHFGTPEYHSAFLPAVPVDSSALRAAAVAALAQKGDTTAAWRHASPVSTVLHGEVLGAGELVDTVDAFGSVNGSQLLASPDELDRLITHAATFRPARTDLREAARRAEATMLSVHAGELIANQTLDFGKQDGVTEIEEALQANEVERRLNDQLWEAETAGTISVPRRVGLVPCVSNFSHFLDMCRKCLRLIEIGVPVMVLSRTHTQQYPYRWFELLAAELKAEGVDPRYYTFCSASIEQQQRVMVAADTVDAAAAVAAAATAEAAAAAGPGAMAPTPCLFTGARPLAQHIKATVSPGLIASTQGPNLMVALGLPPSVARAAALSATIEHSGQCTALRVLVAPAADASAEALEAMFEPTPSGGTAAEYLAAGTFAGVLHPPPASSPLAATAGTPYEPPPGYTAHASQPVAFKRRDTLPDSGAAAEPALEEHWRQVVVDVVTPTGPVGDAEVVRQVGEWLVRHQPISLAINGTTDDGVHAAATAALAAAPSLSSAPATSAASPSASPTASPSAAVVAAALAPLDHLRVARALFERSALCVYSLGDASQPALTAQARPQDGEIFGELPPLGEMGEVTTFPVLGPTPNAAFFASYAPAALRARAARHGLVASATIASPTTDRAAEEHSGATAGPDASATVGALVAAAESAETRGYLLELASYLQTAANGPRRCVGQRTGLYGLQRPPLDGTLTAMRCTELTTLDELLPFALVFAMTNAAPQGMLSIDPANDALLDELPRLQLRAPGLAELTLMLHTEAQFAASAVQATLARTVRPSELCAVHRFPLPQPFVTRLMPAGHIKSSRSDDRPFYQALEPSPKWLRVVPDA